MRAILDQVVRLPFVMAGYRASLNGSKLGWIELCNKLEAFADFQRGRRLLGSPGTGSPAAALDHAMAHPGYTRLWMMEGLGHGYAEGFSLRHRPPANLLRHGWTAELPRPARVPLHAGLGLSFAARLVQEAGESEHSVRSMVERFSDLCRRNALDGYAGVSFEALGFAVRTLRPTLLECLDGVLAALDRRRYTLFWHGVGRGLYFTPSNLVPTVQGRWPAYLKALREPRHDDGRRGAMAGLAWALALVNLRHPEVVETRWRLQTLPSAAADPFSRGAIASLLIWHESNGTDDHLARFLRYENPLCDPRQRRAWRRQLTAPLGRALGSLLEPEDIDRLFRGSGAARQSLKSRRTAPMNERQPDAQALGEHLADFVLPALSGPAGSLSDRLAGRQGAVIVFWSGVCSHCVRYDETLNRFPARHPELALVVIAARQGESAQDLRSMVRGRDLTFPLLHDADRRVAHRWLVRQTPRVFLIDAERRLLYRGAIDNFLYPRDPEYRGYLEAAIDDFLAGAPVRRPETPSFGCPIESVYYTPPKPLTIRPESR